MKSLYEKNGLVFWSEKEIKLRESFRDYFSDSMRTALLATNSQWKFIQIEAPILTPLELVNKNYTSEDMYICDELILRPETTPGSYRFVRDLSTAA